MRSFVPFVAAVLLCGSCCATNAQRAKEQDTREQDLATTADAAEDPNPAATGSVVHGHFGLNNGYGPEPFAPNPNLERDMAALDGLPSMMLRQPGTADLTWDFRHPEPGVWDWEMSDKFFEISRHTLLAELYSHMGLPDFFGADFSQKKLESLAAEGGRRAVSRYFKDNPLDLSKTQQRQWAEEYVTTVVKRYADHVTYWELGTEITAEPTLTEMMRHSYGWVKENDPDAQVLMPGMAGTDPAMFERQLKALDQRLREGMGAYFDITSYHDYGPVDGLASRYDDFAATLAKHGVNKPIWISETGTSSDADSLLSGNSSEERQAREVVQRLVILSAKGAEVVFWHSYRRNARKSTFAGCNIVDRREGPKPAYYTFKLVLEQLDDYQSVEKLPLDEVELFRFTFADRPPVYVAWASTSGMLDLSHELPQAKVTSIVEDRGVTEPTIQTVAGRDIPVSPSPVFITTP